MSEIKKRINAIFQYQDEFDWDLVVQNVMVLSLALAGVYPGRLLTPYFLSLTSTTHLFLWPKAHARGPAELLAPASPSLGGANMLYMHS